MSTRENMEESRNNALEAIQAELARLREQNATLLAALEALLERHAELVNSGDCGFWDVEQEPAMVQTRAAIKGAKSA